MNEVTMYLFLFISTSLLNTRSNLNLHDFFFTTANGRCNTAISPLDVSATFATVSG